MTLSTEIHSYQGVRELISGRSGCGKEGKMKKKREKKKGVKRTKKNEKKI
jgi:hypothetical protein